ncbi:unnamed protein product [Leptosia nina]|uniref:Major facilitator superfamily (MFS) profile domain-containing protein n=1 Tax=Leptosia nina TaxID=320188 RepID=A0AAV1J4H2_9NEOP
MKDQKSSKGHTYKQWLIAILANVALFVYGIENSWISPMTKILQSQNSPAGQPLSDYAISWIASLMCFSAVFGTAMYAYIADRYGRKIAVMGLLYPQGLSWALKLYPTPVTLTLSRIVGGIPAGGCFNVVPMYVKEISQDNIRGTLGSLLILSQNLGVLYMYIIGAYLDYYSVQWAIISIAFVAAILMIKAPEAPAFLIKKGKIGEAIETVASLRGLPKDDKAVLEIIDEMKKQEEQFENLPRIALKDLFTDEKWRRSVLIVLVAASVHGWSGAYAIIVYAFTLLSYAGADFDISPEVQSFCFPIVMIAACFLNAVFVDRLGRKPLLAGAYVASTVSFAVLATTLLLNKNGGSAPGWLPLLAMIVCVFAYAGGISSMLYIIMTEIFNFQIRGKVMGVVVTYIWFVESLQLLIYAPISNFFGYHTLFYIFAGINLVGFIFTLLFIPETKGKSEEEVSVSIKIFFPNIIALCVARAAAGVCAGGLFVVGPMYVREISQQDLIGKLGSIQVVLQNMGFLIIYLVGAYFDYFTVLYITAVFPVMMAVLMLKAPESPAFLVKLGKTEEALKAVAYLRGLDIDDKIVKSELAAMQRQEEEFLMMTKPDFISILKDKAWRRGLIIILIIFSLHAWNGAFAIIAYASGILSSTGVEFNISPELQTLSFPIVSILASFTLTAFAEKFGRKPLLASAFLVSVFSQTTLGVAMLMQKYGYTVPSWLPVICMIISVAGYAGGVRPLPYIILTELFSFQVRARLMGCAVTHAWVSGATQLFAYAPISAAIGLPLTFILFGVFNLLGTCFTFLLPETRGKSDNEIRQQLYKNSVDCNTA